MAILYIFLEEIAKRMQYCDYSLRRQIAMIRWLLHVSSVFDHTQLLLNVFWWGFFFCLLLMIVAFSR